MHITRIVRKSPKRLWEKLVKKDTNAVIYSKIPTVIFNFESYNEGDGGLLDFIKLTENYTTNVDNDQKRYLSSSASTEEDIQYYNMFYNTKHSFFVKFRINELQTNSTLLDYTNDEGKGFKIIVTANTISIHYSTESNDYNMEVPFEYSSNYLLIISRVNDKIICYNKSSIIGTLELENNDKFISINQSIHIGEDMSEGNKLIGDFKIYNIAWCKKEIKGNISIDNY